MLAPNPVSAETHTELIPPEKLHAHPVNPPSRVAASAIAGLLQSIDEFQQREPCRVREHGPIGHYQVLSGHRRHAACLLLGRDVLCQVVDVDDDEALREVMLGNAERDDLNPIERAELMLTMINNGLERLAVGRMFGLESESGVKNTLRLLALPPSIRSLVESGKLPVRAARALVPYAEAIVLMDGVAKHVAEDNWNVDSLVNDCKYKPNEREYRPMDGSTKYNHGWEYAPAVRKFDFDALTDKQRKDLAIVKLPVGPKGSMVEVAQNVKLFDSLNGIHLKKKSGYGDTKKPKAKAAGTVKLTTAAAAAEAKRKAKEADERLAKRLPIWRRRFMRCILATQTPPGHIAIQATSPFWCAEAGNDLFHWIEAAGETLGIKIASRNTHSTEGISIAISSIENGTPTLVDRLWRVLLWPQKIGWKQGYLPGDKAEFDRVPVLLPQKMVGYMVSTALDEPLRMMVELAEVSIAGGWRDSATEGSPENMLFEELLLMHSLDQLRKQAKVWGVEYFPADKKGFIINTIKAKHSAKKPLAMPECLVEGKSKVKAR